MPNQTESELLVTYINENDNLKTCNVLTADGKLMTNRLRCIIRHYPIRSIDPKIGTILLKKLEELQITLIHIQEINSTTEPEVARVRKSIRKNEALYIALFKNFPMDYHYSRP